MFPHRQMTIPMKVAQLEDPGGGDGGIGCAGTCGGRD
jgi:hypothetical protein